MVILEFKMGVAAKAIAIASLKQTTLVHESGVAISLHRELSCRRRQGKRRV